MGIYCPITGACCDLTVTCSSQKNSSWNLGHLFCWQRLATLAPVLKYGQVSICTWSYEMDLSLDTITVTAISLNRFDVWVYTINYIPQIAVDVIKYPCPITRDEVLVFGVSFDVSGLVNVDIDGGYDISCPQATFAQSTVKEHCTPSSILERLVHHTDVTGIVVRLELKPDFGSICCIVTRLRFSTAAISRLTIL